MTEFNKAEGYQETEKFIRENRAGIENVIVLSALAFGINIQGLTIHEVLEKLIQAIESIDATEFNKKIIDILTATNQEKADIAKKISERINSTIKECAKSSQVSVRSKKTKQFVSETDKVTKMLFNRLLNSFFYDDEKEAAPVIVGKKRNNIISVFVTINTDELRGIITLSNDDIVFNPYTRAVHDAVISLYDAGNSYFTEDMIYQVLNGYRRQDKAPENMKKRIHEELQKLMHTGIKIDATAEAKAFRLSEFKFEGYVLPITYSMTKINGTICECWKILDEPPLLTLASRKNQINRCNIKLLDTGLNCTPDNTVIRNYLLEQILNMQNEKSNRNSTILYDSLYEYLGIDAQTEASAETKRRRTRDKVKDILDTWTKSEFIKGYQEYSEGRKIIGLHIVW